MTVRELIEALSGMPPSMKMNCVMIGDPEREAGRFRKTPETYRQKGDGNQSQGGRTYLGVKDDYTRDWDRKHGFTNHGKVRKG